MLGTEQTGDLLLALDTSGDVCSVALLRGGQLVSEHTFLHRMHLSERLLEHFSAVLRDANAKLDDVAVFGIGIGPGSFTGTRIGVMTMKTLAAVQRRPIYSVDSLLAVAGSYRGIERSLVVPILPCRTGVVFAALFRYGRGVQMPWVGIEPVALSLPELCQRIGLCVQDLSNNLSNSLFDGSPNNLSKSLSNALYNREWAPEVILCGAANERYGEEIRDLLAVTGQGILTCIGSATVPRASEIARIAWDRRQAGDAGEDPLEIVPLYIAPPPISQPKPENRPPVLQNPVLQNPVLENPVLENQEL